MTDSEILALAKGMVGNPYFWQIEENEQQMLGLCRAIADAQRMECAAECDGMALVHERFSVKARNTGERELSINMSLAAAGCASAIRERDAGSTANEMQHRTSAQYRPRCPGCGYQLDDEDMASNIAEDDLFILAVTEGLTSVECPQCNNNYFAKGGYIPIYTTSFCPLEAEGVMND